MVNCPPLYIVPSKMHTATQSVEAIISYILWNDETIIGGD
jgi:hypothetical protein